MTKSPIYRLNVFPLHLPPLSQRVEDIPVLAQHFLVMAAREYGRDVAGFDPVAMERMEKVDWPGNVRQLRNAIERAVILCSGTRIGVAEIQESEFCVIATICNHTPYAKLG